MKVDEYFVIPLELQPEELETALQQADKSDWEESELPGVGEQKAYRITKSTANRKLPTRVLHVVFVDTCLCMVYHRWRNVEARWGEESAKCINALLRRKECILKKVDGNIKPQSFRTALKKLGADAAEAKATTYGFSIYVLTRDEKINYSLEADISKLIKAPTHETFRRAAGSSSRPLSRNVDSANSTAVYASYSAVVGVAWTGKGRTADEVATELKNILLQHQLRLQAAWNRAHQASRQLDERLHELNDQSERKKELELDANEFLGFVRISQLVHQALTPAVSARERFIFDELVATSRIQDEIDALMMNVGALDKMFERSNERRLAAVQRSVEDGQRWVTNVFAIFAGASLAQGVVGSLESLPRWWLLAGTAMGGGIAFGIVWLAARVARSKHRV